MKAPFQLTASPLVQAVRDWFRLNTRSPGWVPTRWQHPLVGYLLVGPLVGLLWGAGPGLLVTLLGTVLLYYVVYPPHFALCWKDLVDMVESGGVMIAGLFITLVVSHHDTHQHALQQCAQEEAALR